MIDVRGLAQDLFRFLLGNAAGYEKNLHAFPMTAFDVIKTRIRAFGEQA